MMKRCGKCKVEKPLSAFNNNCALGSGKSWDCKECRNHYAKNRYHNVPGVREKRRDEAKEKLKNNPEYRESHLRYSKKHYESVDGRAANLFNHARRRSKQIGVEHTVTLEHIRNQIALGFCAVTKLPFDLISDKRHILARKKYNPCSPSIDRINPNKGYTNENTRVVIWWYNMAKGQLSDLEMLDFCKLVVEIFR